MNAIPTVREGAHLFLYPGLGSVWAQTGSSQAESERQLPDSRRSS